MLRTIFVAIGVTAMVLGGILPAHAEDRDRDDDGNKKGGHRAILNAVTSGNTAHGQLSGEITALSGGHQGILDAVTGGTSSSNTGHTTLQGEHATQNTAHGTLQSEHAAQNTVHGTLQTEHGAQNAAHGTLQTEHATQSTEHNDLSQQLTDIQTAIANLSSGGGAPPTCEGGTAGQRFVVSQDSTEVCDNTTGLNWQKNPDSTQRTHADALAHCPTVREGSRLPEVKELISLLDYTRFNPALPASHPFTNVQSAGYWSAPALAGVSTFAWLVEFFRGVVSFDSKTITGPGRAWCVRGA